MSLGPTQVCVARSLPRPQLQTPQAVTSHQAGRPSRLHATAEATAEPPVHAPEGVPGRGSLSQFGLSGHRREAATHSHRPCPLSQRDDVHVLQPGGRLPMHAGVRQNGSLAGGREAEAGCDGTVDLGQQDEGDGSGHARSGTRVRVRFQEGETCDQPWQ